MSSQISGVSITRLLALLLSSACLVNAQAQYDQNLEEEAAAELEQKELFQVKSVNLQNWKDVIMKDSGHNTNIFLLFRDEHCRECRRGASEMAHLAQRLGEQRQAAEEGERQTPQVGFVDCMYDMPLCDTFKANERPHMLLIQNKRVYKYEGSLEADLIESWIADEDNLGQSLIDRNVEKFVVGNEQELRQNQMAANAVEQESDLAIAFDQVFRTPIAFIFFHAGLDHYSKFTKVSLFCLLLLVPLVIFVFALTMELVREFLGYDDQPPQLVPTATQQSQQQQQNQLQTQQAQAQTQAQPQAQQVQQQQVQQQNPVKSDSKKVQIETSQSAQQAPTESKKKNKKSKK